MSVASPSTDDCTEVFVEQDDHGHSAVNAITDKGLAQLVKWLDLRLQQHEDNLRSLLIAQDSRTGQGSVKIEPQVTSQGFRMKSQESALEQSHWMSPNFDNGGSCPIPSEAHRHQRIPHMATEREMECTASQEAFSPATRAPSFGRAVTDKKQLWLSTLTGIFDQLDLNQTGSIGLKDLEKACHATGFSEVQALKVLCFMDESENGSINRLEWLHMISKSQMCSDDDRNLLDDFLSRLVQLQHDQGSIYKTGEAQRVRMILRHDSVWRVMWDLMKIVVLSYVAVALPFSMGFGSSMALDAMGMVVDIFFCCDIALNFRTSYLDRDDTVVVDWRRIGKRYLKSWFLLDLFSSLPLDLFTMGVLPDPTPLRLYKLGKTTRVLKFLHISKIKSVKVSESLEIFQNSFSSRPFMRTWRTLKLLFTALLVCHWLACFSNAVDSATFDDYFSSLGQVPNKLQRYIAGMYWAMTTVSTVGYGDITPISDQERAFSMFAMVIGGALYGYIVGSVTSIVTDIDTHAFAFGERMEGIQSWLDGRQQIPKLLRRRMRKHFEYTFDAKAVIDDSSVINQLSGELRGDAAFWLVDKYVRHHPMMANLSKSALAELVCVLQETHAEAHETVVELSAPGRGMYFLIQGLARYDHGFKWQPPGAKDAPKKFQHIARGESFGEEIIFGLAGTYTYTVITVVGCKFNWIQATSFRRHFKDLPELSAQMYAAVVPHHKSSGELATSSHGAKFPMYLSQDETAI